MEEHVEKGGIDEEESREGRHSSIGEDVEKGGIDGGQGYGRHWRKMEEVEKRGKMKEGVKKGNLDGGLRDGRHRRRMT